MSDRIDMKKGYRRAETAIGKMVAEMAKRGYRGEETDMSRHSSELIGAILSRHSSEL